MAGANWDAYNLPAIWSMLKQENACTGADRVLSWDGLAHDVRTQHRRLLDASESLAAVWSPDKNASARIFLERMNVLAESMAHTLTRAEDTRAGLRGILEALSEAQAAVQPWVEVRQEVSDDLIPRWADHAEDEYDDKARQAMRKAEAAIADHSTQIQPPELYDPGRRRGGSDQPIGGDGTGTDGHGTGSSDGSGSHASAGSVRATPISVPVPHDPPVETRIPGSGGELPLGTGPSTADSRGTGIDLAGVLPAPSTVPAPVAGPGIPPVAAAPGGLGGGALPGSVIGGGGLFGVTPGMGTGGALTPVPLGGGAPRGRQAVPVRTAMPSGTVLGAPSTGARSPSAARGGGVGGRGTAGQPLAQTAPGQRGRRSDAVSESIDGKADQAWDVLHGVEPVIAPDTRPARHDPGPGVIGLSS
ncbi:hypothetical protein AB0368_24425 [Actinoplanes sp. NPDC051475]|uniref:hypothetical protein n=1 Tax=Actinoplanes sp. NPDC051475 TaxID=3157225 RepID=UPI00344DDECE